MIRIYRVKEMIKYEKLWWLEKARGAEERDMNKLWLPNVLLQHHDNFQDLLCPFARTVQWHQVCSLPAHKVTAQILLPTRGTGHIFFHQVGGLFIVQGFRVLLPLCWAIALDLRFWLIFNMFQNHIISRNVVRGKTGIMNCCCFYEMYIERVRFPS
jgi:hypothetical protein